DHRRLWHHFQYPRRLFCIAPQGPGANSGRPIPDALPAFFVLGVWIGLQFANAAMTSGAAIGGVVLVVPFRGKSVPLLNGWHLLRKALAKRLRWRIPESGRRR
ncbi:MAG: hypothetical protein AAEC10_09195, partial [Rhodospirillales bacterium]